MSEIISQEIIENFLNGSDSEEYIVGVEYDYRTNKIFKIIQHPEKGKFIKQDNIVPFLWVGDLTGLNFYKNDKILQKNKMGEHGILIEKLQTGGNKRLENGLTYLVKSIKGYTNVYFTPLWATETVRVITDLASINESGIFHVVGSERFSKYEFGCLLAENLKIERTYVEPVEYFNSPGAPMRSLDLSLSNQKLKRTGIEFNEIREILRTNANGVF